MTDSSAPHPAVRCVRKEDFSRWQTLWEGYNEFYGRSGETALHPDITKQTWSRFHDPYEPAYALVAEMNSDLVGFAHYIFHRNTNMISPTCYLQDLFTVSTCRGQGVGRALIERVYKEAKDAGLSRVYWQTHESNNVARALYDKIADRSGFIIYKKDLLPK